VGIAVVTGAAGGLGAAVAELLTVAGSDVVGLDVRDATVVGDLSRPRSRADAVGAIRAAAGHAIDLLVCCAGLGPTVDDHGAIVSVNFFGTIELLDGLVDSLSAGADPAVVLTSSNSITIDPTVDEELVSACVEGEEDAARSRAGQLPGHSVYASSKLAVARALRRRVERLGGLGVRANAVAPGPFESALLDATRRDPELGPAAEALPVPIGRTGSPADVAAVIAFLASPAARYVHGSVVFVDGGIDALFRPDGP